jgi:hypothetical protein
MERRVGASALLTLALLLGVGLVAGLLLASLLVHGLALLGVHTSAAQGSGLGHALVSWLP